MVTYCLGISCVCPLRWGLYFERFLNVQRGDCPDIDIDICGARRDELLDYVYARWGAEHVAMIASFITMHARLAVREIAKVFGVPPGEVNHFTKRLPHRPVREILDAIKNLPECRSLPIHDEPWKTILQVALRLDDAPRHLGIHPCGTVIFRAPVDASGAAGTRRQGHRRHAIRYERDRSPRPDQDGFAGAARTHHDVAGAGQH